VKLQSGSASIIVRVPSPAGMPRSYAQLCGIATALDVIGDRWTPLIVRDLLLGPLRFGDLADGLAGIGTNTLTERLKGLEAAGVIARRLLALPERGTVYELTDYGRELEPILMALGRWGTKSMGRLPPDVTSRSRWLVAAMLAFHDDSRRVARPTTWELRLNDGAFTVRARDTSLTVTAGAPDVADLVVTTADDHMHALLTHQLAPARAVRSGAVTLDGDISALERLVDLFAFPAL
jgi:DNA-binding HxlR family transcriptional regulator